MTATSSPSKSKTVYCLRIRASDSEPWGEPTLYATRKARDYDEKMCRIMGGMRVHSYTEKKTTEELESITLQ
jgi:hypothetical protein